MMGASDPGMAAGGAVLRVAPMTLADLDEVLAVENLSFTTPWSRQSFYYELTENPRALYLVVREDGNLAGYIGMWIVFDEGHITNLAVHPGHRRRGVATLLLDALTAAAKERGVTRLTLEVRRSNVAAQLLYARYGFVCSGVRRRYYRDNNEDALIMWKAPI
ncbi:MAG: ribosomal protein S18-alanine N-acetyltransferase [Bacteroidota bacterium]